MKFIYQYKNRERCDLAALIILVDIEEKSHFVSDVKELELLDKMFEVCGYIKSTYDVLYDKGNDKYAIRRLQYEPVNGVDEKLRLFGLCDVFDYGERRYYKIPYYNIPYGVVTKRLPHNYVISDE